MVVESRAKSMSEEQLFTDSLKVVGNENCLGSRQTIESLVRFAVSEFADIMAVNIETASPTLRIRQQALLLKHLRLSSYNIRRSFTQYLPGRQFHWHAGQFVPVNTEYATASTRFKPSFS